MHIVFFETDEVEAGILLDLYGDIDYDTVKEPLNESNADRYAGVEVLSCFIYSNLNSRVLKKLKNLKFIATRSRSADHIDLDYCEKNGIVVSNVPAYGEHTVAEHVFSLLLSIAHNIPQLAQQTKEGNFSLRGLQGFDLFGKTMGIIGTGSIGLHAAEIAKGFGMNVLGYDIRPREDIARKTGFTYTSLDDLLSRADIISLHVTDSGKAQHLLAEREFALMKKGVTLINTSCGSAIDIKALLKALANGKIRAAGLDVLPDEPAIRDDAEFLRESFFEKHDAKTLLTSHALQRHKNVIITPHSAFYTKETVETILRTTGGNIEAFLKKAPSNTVSAVPALAKAAP